MQKAQDELIKNVSIKGFRKGSVPRDLALKHIKAADTYSHAIKDELETLGKEAAKEITKEHFIIDGPTYIVENVDDKNLEIKFVYPVYPQITLADYKKINAKYEEKSVDDKVIKGELDRIKKMKMIKKQKTGNIAKGDVVKFDFEGFIDNKPFPGGKAEKFELEIGSNKFIPGFEDQMIGLKQGSAEDIKVTFPETYHEEKLKGKEALFKIKIHEINTQEEPKIDDAFVKTLGIQKVETVASLKSYLKDLFALQFTNEARAKFQREAFDQILKDTKLIIPPALIAKEMKAVAEQMTKNLKAQKLTLEQYMKFTGLDKAKMSTQFRTAAEKRLNDAFVFAEIAKREKISISESDYEREYKKLAKLYHTDEKSIQKMVTKQQMQIPITNDRVIDFLISHSDKKSA